jgi:hypothetical protein
MNDSCEHKLNLVQLPSNQVFPLEAPKGFLHCTLAH